jgi:hypothetical protein
MADPEQERMIQAGPNAWNSWRKQNRWTLVDLRGVRLRSTDLSGIDLHATDLTGADLDHSTLDGSNLKGAILNSTSLQGSSLQRSTLFTASLRSANLDGAILQRAELGRANLTRALLTDANLTGADLRGADLSFTNLRGSMVRNASLKGAQLSGTIFGNTDLSGIADLEECIHLTPSVVDFFTLAKSKPLPPVFLRGCGMPDIFIEYLPSLLANPIEFHSCFISYSTKDETFAERLYLDLQVNGVKSWFSPHDVRGGRKLYEQIDEAIRIHDRLLVILSSDSMSSEWVKTEISKARQREMNEHRSVLFPVSLVPFAALKQWECFDADIGKDSAREIREYYIPDFSEWLNPTKYRQEFGRLLRDLKTGNRSFKSRDNERQ